MSVTAIIPARAGSKRLTGKNLLPLGGIPLIEKTIQFAVASCMFDKIIVSSDSPEVIDIAQKYDVCVDVRPESLATDNATSSALLEYLVSKFSLQLEADGVIVYLEPTSPFRKTKSLRGALEIFNESAAMYDSLVTYTSHDEPLGLRMENLWVSNDKEEGARRSQDRPNYYLEASSFWILRVKSFLKYKTFNCGACYAFEVNAIEAIDINSKADFDFAEIVEQGLKGCVR